MRDDRKEAGGRRGLDRRRFLAGSALGLGAAAVPGWAQEVAKDAAGGLARGDLAAVEKLAGLAFTDADRDLMLEDVAELRADYEALRQVRVDNAVPPAFRFDPVLPGTPLPRGESSFRLLPGPPPVRPRDDEELAFLPATALSRLLAAGEVTSVELTRLYLERLKRFDPALLAVVTLIAEPALARAEQMDRELAAGRSRGPLHGIPWGAKDLLAVRGHRTTWGAGPFRDQVIDEDATVVERLERAGAVLVAKTTLGELAWGDVWYGGTTRNPWKLDQGSSGSSAGSAATTAAGLVGFAIGSETLGSIVSPCTRTGATGLRPTFGRVSRHGAMALSWTMDKLGPICRSVEDCALVLAAIAGPDGKDSTVADAPFVWGPGLDPERLRVGYVKALFDAEPEEEAQKEWHAFNLATLDVLRGLGWELAPIELPALPVSALGLILSVEAAAAFDELTRSGADDKLVRQIRRAWPNVFRVARTVPAVEYVQANRVRTLLQREMARRLADVDVYVCPSFGGENLLITNLTGHPSVVLPNGFRKDGTPTSITFMGHLYREAEVLAVAKAYQDATDFHLRRPQIPVVAAPPPIPPPPR
jgi:Asp-tRNA(Asn)/Glu-tRNA(Gln) amidotransferase A subunit family amidase